MFLGLILLGGSVAFGCSLPPSKIEVLPLNVYTAYFPEVPELRLVRVVKNVIVGDRSNEMENLGLTLDGGSVVDALEKGNHILGEWLHIGFQNSRNSKKGNLTKAGSSIVECPNNLYLCGHIESTRLSQIGDRYPSSSVDSIHRLSPLRAVVQGQRVDRKCDRNSSAFLILHRLDLGIRSVSACQRCIGSLLCGFDAPKSNQDSTSASYGEKHPRSESDPVKEIPVSVPLNRDVCGWYYADRYGAILVLSCFAIGIILECFAITILFEKRRWLGWSLAAISLFFWLVAGQTVPIGRLPWDWWKTPKGCKENTY